jgi:hypothetical protein
LACKHAFLRTELLAEVFGQLLRSSAESSSKSIPFLELSWEDAPMKNCSTESVMQCEMDPKTVKPVCAS